MIGAISWTDIVQKRVYSYLKICSPLLWKFWLGAINSWPLCATFFDEGLSFDPHRLGLKKNSTCAVGLNILLSFLFKSYDLLEAIKPDKERAPSPSSASSFPPSLRLFMEKGEGMVQGLKRLASICGAGVPASARGHLKRGEHLPVEKRGSWGGAKITIASLAESCRVHAECWCSTLRKFVL